MELERLAGLEVMQHRCLHYGGQRVDEGHAVRRVVHREIDAARASDGDRLRDHRLEQRAGGRCGPDDADRQPLALVQRLGLELDGEGFVRIEPMRCETSVPGIYAAGDLTTRAQGAIFAAAAGMQAAASLNLDLTLERPL